MSNGWVKIRKMESSENFSKDDINIIDTNVKNFRPIIIKDELISLLDLTKSKTNIDHKKEDRISKISFYLGKIFDKQIDKIQRNYSYSKDRKKVYSSTNPHYSTDTSRNSNNFENSRNSANDEINKENLNNFLEIRRKNENSRNSRDQNNYLDVLKTNNMNCSKNKIERSKPKNFQLDAHSNNGCSINSGKINQQVSIGLPPKIKKPPINKSSNYNLNLKIKNDDYIIYSHNFSIVNDSLKFGEPYTFELVKNKIISSYQEERNKNIKSSKFTNMNKLQNNIIICAKQESLSIMNVKYKESHEMSFDIKSISTNKKVTQEKVENIKENHITKETCQITYKKPKIGSSSYRSNKENNNLIYNNAINYTIDITSDSSNNQKPYFEKELNMNNNHLENTKLYNKLSSLNSTFLDYELNNLNKIRIISNKPSINMSHIENESIDETSIHKNSQYIDINGVSYISDGIKGFFNNTTLEKSQIDDKNISFKLQRNNSSILNIQSPNPNNNSPEEINQLKSENSSISLNKETELKNITNNSNRRKEIDLKLKKDFDSFKFKRNKNHTVDYDRYLVKNEDSFTNKNIYTEIFNEKIYDDPDLNNVTNLSSPRLNNLNRFPYNYSLCDQNMKIDETVNRLNNNNEIDDSISNEKKIQRLKSYKSIKLSNAENMLSQLPEKIEAFTSANLSFIRPENNLIKNELRTTVNEFHPLELENTMTSISITASQNLRKSIMQPNMNIQTDKETNVKENHPNNIPVPQKFKEFHADNINSSDKTIKKISSYKKLPDPKIFNSAKKREILNDSLDSKSKISGKKGSIIAKIKLNSAYSSKKLNKETHLEKSLNKKLLNKSKRDQKKEKEIINHDSYKITI